MHHPGLLPSLIHESRVKLPSDSEGRDDADLTCPFPTFRGAIGISYDGLDFPHGLSPFGYLMVKVGDSYQRIPCCGIESAGRTR